MISFCITYNTSKDTGNESNSDNGNFVRISLPVDSPINGDEIMSLSQ